MRKKTIKHTADTIFWYLIYFMPAICYFLLFWNNGEQTISLAQMFTQYGFGVTNNNIIATSLQQIFGANGIMPLFTDMGIIYLLTWFASCMIIHLAVDFLLFIVRLSHKWLNKFTQGD